jgi:hypothetical protein
MCVLGAQRKAAQWALVKDGEARRAVGGCLGNGLLHWLGVVSHFSILLRGDVRYDDVWAYPNLLRFDVK